MQIRCRTGCSTPKIARPACVHHTKSNSQSLKKKKNGTEITAISFSPLHIWAGELFHQMLVWCLAKWAWSLRMHCLSTNNKQELPWLGPHKRLVLDPGTNPRPLEISALVLSTKQHFILWEGQNLWGVSPPEHCWSNKARQIYPNWGIGFILFRYK